MKTMLLKLAVFCVLWCLVGGGFTLPSLIKSVKEGESVTINIDLTKIKQGDRIQWWLSEYVIAEISVMTGNLTVYDEVLDERIRGRLELDNQTGSLTITNITTEYTGYYKAQTIDGLMLAYKILIVYIEVSATEGESVTLNTGLTEISEHHIEWQCERANTLIHFKRSSNYLYTLNIPDKRFKDRLEVDNQTGSLTITNITTEYAGDYYLKITGGKVSFKIFKVSVYAHLPFPVISRNSSNCASPSSSSNCSLLCSAVNVGHVTLSWFKGNSVLSSISVSDLSISLSLSLEVDYQDNNTYSCVLHNPIRNQTTHLDISRLCQPCSGSSVPRPNLI